MLSQFIASASHRHTAVIMVKENNPALDSLNFKLNQHLTLHVIIPVWPENRYNISSEHCFLGAFLKAILKENVFVKIGKVRKKM